MKTLKPRPSMADQVYDRIAEEISTGRIVAGEHLVQEQLAARLGVSRQPIQQAMNRLKADGLIEQIGKRGLQVAPLDMDRMRHHYAIRAALDGLAVRESALRARRIESVRRDLERQGQDILRKGEAAVAAGALIEQVRQDAALHGLFYRCSGNPLLAQTAEPHWRFLRRAMAEVLRHAELPGEIWRQHAEILDAVLAGDVRTADDLMTAHDLDAAEALQTAFAKRGAGTSSKAKDL